MLEKHLQGLSTEELKQKLELVISKCFISGIVHNLSIALQDIGCYFTPVSEEIYKMLEEQDVEFTRKTSEQSKQSALELIQKVKTAYEQLPFAEMDSSDPVYEPFFETQEHLDYLSALLPFVFDASGKESTTYKKAVATFKNISGHSQAIERAVMDMTLLLTERTGEKFAYKVAQDIHDPPYKPFILELSSTK